MSHSHESRRALSLLSCCYGSCSFLCFAFVLAKGWVNTKNKEKWENERKIQRLEATVCLRAGELNVFFLKPHRWIQWQVQVLWSNWPKQEDSFLTAQAPFNCCAAMSINFTAVSDSCRSLSCVVSRRTRVAFATCYDNLTCANNRGDNKMN